MAVHMVYYDNVMYSVPNITTINYMNMMEFITWLYNMRTKVITLSNLYDTMIIIDDIILPLIENSGIDSKKKTYLSQLIKRLNLYTTIDEIQYEQILKNI